MREIISSLERNRSKIDLRNFGRIVSAFRELGYLYEPRRMRGTRWKIAEVLPQIVVGLEKDDNNDITPLDVRDALRRGGVRV